MAIPAGNPSAPAMAFTSTSEEGSQGDYYLITPAAANTTAWVEFYYTR